MTYYEVVKWLESINPILVFIVALMSFIGIGYGFYLWLSKVIFKPRLKLRLPSEYIISRPDTKTRYDHRWGHIEVYNKSSTLVKYCQAWISTIDFHEAIDDLSAKFLFPSKIHLIWTGTENRYLIEISPKQGALLDLFKFRGDGMVLSHDNEGHIKEVVHGKGIYIINIECIAENAKSDKMRLKMTFVKDNQPPTLEVLK